MKNHKLQQISLILLCLTFFQNSAMTQTSVAAPETIQKQNELIHFGDLIDVDVVGSFEYDWRGTLNPEGFLDGLDFVEEPVFALCRTEEEIAREVAKGYEKLLREPKVAVRILDRSNRAHSVMQGAVKKPQRFLIKRAVNLNELLIAAGGLTDRASGEVQIFRPQDLSCAAKTSESIAQSESADTREKFLKTSGTGGTQMLTIKISELLKGTKEANPQILTGDIITVLEAEPIYIIGGVNSPKQISSRSQITLSRAIASAGGLAKDALENEITVFRREGRETKILNLDMGKISSNQAEDIVLRAFDIVEVGQKGREKRKNPPIVQLSEESNANSASLPLRIID